ncbi:pyridoxamine 5'-phosphate oxidase family protein [Phytoactinopolyspora mesophila]|uniref:Pyridoxamine 5'-phosphate oxidase family protein n=1 Tax=Phytoactinopolyspora mesophila TaxID=2650750 RepID=A0A7K3M0Q2_9ACTN|nr:pyridoxamine 5'-phosphate oxidase family protein [Phytoactinopolyspora mesophila]NDL56854.1 pyridoxamine 5'-phosphate oxidase family protein [Phytoactinopolyspora mesophila]
MAAPRAAQQRKADTLRRLEKGGDAWIATGDENGNAHLVPLSSYWDGSALIIYSPTKSITARNLRRGGRVRAGVGPTRDVTIIEGHAELLSDDERTSLDDAIVPIYEWDARQSPNHQMFRIVPRRIQAWREENEIEGRDLMRDGQWLV